MKTFLVYQRQLNNLSIQEHRLRRQREKDTAALLKIQNERKEQETKRMKEAATAYIQAVAENRNHTFDPVELGFEFSMAQIELRALEIQPDLFAEWARQLEQAA